MDRLIKDAQAVVDAVTMDDQGQLIGQQWVGGNGGMLSIDTLKAVDRLRLTLAEVKIAGKGPMIRYLVRHTTGTDAETLNPPNDIQLVPEPPEVF